MQIWEDSMMPNVDVGLHAALSYDAAARAGYPARPLEFPTPTVLRAARRDVIAIDHISGRVHPVKHVLMPADCTSLSSSLQLTAQPDRAYLLKKKLSKSVYGDVRLAIVLIRRSMPPSSQTTLSSSHRRANSKIRDEDVEWESTGEMAAVKISSWSKIRQLRGRHLEDPVREIAAMQLLGNYHPNVQGSLDILQDDNHLYTVMPYCSGGDLFGKIIGTEQRAVSQSTSGSEVTVDYAGCGVDESQARVWFRQLLSGLFRLQQKGVCHRDISLENIMVDENDKVVIIDLGMALRVPYRHPCNPGGVSDVSEGTERLLIQAQGQGGKLMYMAPEIIARDDAFDGFAVDIWAAGVVLFVTLIGLAPFKWAHESDRRYAKIAKGQLKKLLVSLNIHLSDEACDLLQNMFWRDPRKRLTLSQIMEHPWVLDRHAEATHVYSDDTKATSTTSKNHVSKLSWFHRTTQVRPTAH